MLSVSEDCSLRCDISSCLLSKTRVTALNTSQRFIISTLHLCISLKPTSFLLFPLSHLLRTWTWKGSDLLSWTGHLGRLDQMTCYQHALLFRSVPFPSCADYVMPWGVTTCPSQINPSQWWGGGCHGNLSEGWNKKAYLHCIHFQMQSMHPSKNFVLWNHTYIFYINDIL